MRASQFIVVSLALAACRGDDPPETDSTGEQDSSEAAGHDPQPTSSTGESDWPPGTQHPQEAAWQTVVDELPFPPEVKTLTIGRAEFNDNFANGGDVEVYFDQETPVITVEMRVFDFTDDLSFHGDGDALGSSQRLHIWAYATEENPRQPADMPSEADCTKDAWKDNCKLYAYFDGKAMPVRMGADLRVHLPKAYRGELVVFTDDNDNEPTYRRLSDVVIDEMCGSGQVTLRLGSATIKLCDELTPTPTCAPEQVAACAEAAWSPECPCPPELFGRLRVDALAGDITVDVPDTTWMNVTAANFASDPEHACAPQLDDCAADSCTSTETVYVVLAEFNDPGPAAPPGGGYELTAVSQGCEQVEFYAAPDDWSPASTPMLAEHGHVRICSGCL